MYRLIFILCILINNLLIGQSLNPYELFNNGNFKDAIPEFEILYKEQPKNTKLAHHLAVCYLNTNGDKARAIPILEKITLDNDDAKPIYWYLLGRSYHFGYQFMRAIDCFYNYLTFEESNEDVNKSSKEYIQYCIHGNELMKYTRDVSFENLGKNINSQFDDYFPFIPVDESYIMFNSKRGYKSSSDNLGQYYSNIYYSNVNLGKFQKAKLLSNQINSIDNSEEIVGMNNNGDKLVFCKWNSEFEGSLISGIFKEKNLVETRVMNKIINSKHDEIAGCIINDQFYFASNRPNGYGGIDIYRCQRLPNGNWSDAYNLGPDINTPNDEDFPSISSDGKTLYFSSKGHYSMGGYDIFQAKWDSIKSRFSNVENLGYPINTPEDNMSFRISKDKRYGYVSAVRKEGLGGLDVYRVTFNSVKPSYSVVIGKVNTEEETEEMIDITITDLSNYRVYGEYTPNELTKKYIMILPPGKYLLNVDCNGFESISEKIEILDKSSFRSEIIKNISLKTAR